MRVLFTNSGRRTYLIEFALKMIAAGRDLEVYVSDCDPLVPTFHMDPRVRTLISPPVTSDPEGYFQALAEAVRTHRIELIIPLSDLELEILARNRAALAEVGAKVAIGSPATILNCMDKRQTFLFCRGHDLPTPDSWFSLDAFPGRFPAIRKRLRGSGGDGFARIDTPEALAGFVAGTDLLQAFIAGREYGLDILNDFSGRFVSSCAKRKLLQRAGETDRAEIVDHPDLIALARRISSAFAHVGNMDVDVIVDAAGAPHCLDFNPRFGGGYPATHLAGFDYLGAVFDMAAGRPVRLPAAPRPVVVTKGISVYSVERA